jgi:hypothetical protein
MTDIRSLEQTLLENLPWNKARIKFVARFLLALYAVQTVNLSILANAFSGPAQIESNYKRLQRFLRQFEMPYAELAEFVVRLLGLPGPYTLALDRTNWSARKTSRVYWVIANSSDANGFALSSAIGSSFRCDCTETRWCATDVGSMYKLGVCSAGRASIALWSSPKRGRCGAWNST